VHPLHITKVAFGCSSLDVLAERLEARAASGETTVGTRYKPKRADELIGGSLFWILKHQLVARQTIVGFGEEEDGKRCIIRVSAGLVPVRAYPKRAHQGWRYLNGGDAPLDLLDGDVSMGELPPRRISELAALALI
jgi:hypothetical protein